MKKITLLVLLMVLGLTITTSAQTPKFAALAIDKANGFYYGWAHDFASAEEAGIRALAECTKKGGSCSVVLSWSGAGCGAYRTVSGSGTAYGWGIAATQTLADGTATREALKRSGGKPAANYAYSCNSADAGTFEIIKNENSETSKGKLADVKDIDGDLYDYEGEILDNLPHGFGSFTYKNGTKFSGNFSNGRRNGKGTLIYTDGERYEGEYNNDRREGKGTYFFANGNRYEGDFKNGKRNGKGITYFASGDKYEGDFKDERFNGFGTYTISPSKDAEDAIAMANCKKYIGEFVGGKPSGSGKCYDSSGKLIYSGNFLDGEPSGN